ncbi:MAG: LamG-like jellyroll fold domain-containing protein [Candidatus Competibacteraceae bacterium]
MKQANSAMLLRHLRRAIIKVSYAGWQGAVNELSPLREASGKPSGLWGPTIQPQKILTTLVSTKWTFEFWLKLNSVPTATAYILDLGDAYLPGLTIALHNDEHAFRFQFNNDYAGLHSACLTHSNITDFQWHHIAFTRVGEVITHFVDGVLQTQCDTESVVSQPLPEFWEPTNWGTDAHGFTEDSPDEWRRQNRFNISLGEGRDGDGDLDGLLDEMRFSNTVRYSNNNNNNWFPVPGSFARNYSENAPRPAVRTGPPLLFGGSAPTNDSVQLGGRKYVFIDDALLDTKDNVALELNSLNLAELRKDLTLVISATDMIPFQPGHGDWRETIYDHDGKVYLFINDSYTSQYGISRLYVSKDGLNFTVPNLSIVTGLPENYVFYKRPMGATIIKDQNPNISPEERFKIMAYGPNRGIYLYVSPDGIRWRRNELAMLPLIHGGDPETFWDDQQGEYVTHLKRDSSYHTDDCPGNGRRGVRFSSADPFRPWPMRKEAVSNDCRKVLPSIATTRPAVAWATLTIQC